MKTELERCKEALQVAIEELGTKNRHTLEKTCEAASVEALERMDKILNPPVEMETFKVVRWYCPKCNSTDCETGGHFFESVKLTGTYPRPKKQPVERSVPVTLESTLSGHVVATFDALADRSAVIDKTGTFIWVE